MKTLFIIRHANAESASIDGSDFSRALCAVGIKEAKNIGLQLIQKNIAVDAIVYSAALRTMQTAQQLAAICCVEEGNLFAEPLLYLADSNKIESVVSQFTDDKNNVAVVCHNPGITDFVHSLVPHKFSGSMSTCMVVAVRSDAKSWSDFTTSKKELLFVLSPE